MTEQQQKQITFGSVCSGIEAASVAWEPLGWKASWLSEIEPFPAAVLAHHYPDTPNLGDMLTIAAKVRAGAVPAPDVLTGGTPCQAFSVAGLRNSLNDSRGQLTIAFIDLLNAIDEQRQQQKQPPAIAIWENVPGVLNTADNAFGCFLAGLAGEDVPLEPPGGKWKNAGAVFGPKRTVAWRVLDAQYFGVAQRRRRVWVVASAGTVDPCQILFEQEGVRRDTAPSRSTGQEIASNAGSSPAATIRAGNFELWAFPTEARSPALTAQRAHDTLAYGLPGNWIGRKPENGSNQVMPNDNHSPCLTATDRHAVAFEPGKMQRLGYGVCEQDLCPTLRAQAGDNQQAVAFSAAHFTRGVGAAPADVVGTLTAQAKAGDTQPLVACSQPSYVVRKLTPRECERLQGFPDDYTLIPWKGKPVEDCPDSPRYKALGNSWAVPVAKWVAERIARFKRC